MFGKKLFSIFGMLVAGAIGVTTLGVTTSLIGVGIAQGGQLVENKIPGDYHETFKQVKTDQHNTTYVETSLGNRIEVKTLGDYSVKDKLVVLNNQEYFDFVTPIGGIIDIALDVTINGKAISDGQKPLEMDFAYLTDPGDISSEYFRVSHEKIPEFVDDWIFGQGKTYETPSNLRFRATMDNVEINSIKLHYNCAHHSSEILSAKGVYLVGDFAENYPNTTNSGIKGNYNGQHEFKNILLHDGDTIFFKEPTLPGINNIELKEGGDFCAVKDKAITNKLESTTKFDIHFNGFYDFFLKDEFNGKRELYVNYKKEASYYDDWYLVGDYLKIGDKLFENQSNGTKPGWDINAEAKLTKKADTVSTYEIKNVELKAGKGYKVRGVVPEKYVASYGWINNLNRNSTPNCVEVGQDTNIYIKENMGGLYNIELNVSGTPSITFIKL